MIHRWTVLALVHFAVLRKGSDKICERRWMHGLGFGFFLHGSANRPRSCGLTFFREAPRLGLTGVTTITIGEHGVVGEAVAYDLNPALDVLGVRPTTLTCGLK